MTPAKIDTILFDFDGTLATLNIDFPLMRENILALIGRYNISPDGYKNLYVLEMIEAGRIAVSRSRISDGNDFEKRALALVRNMEIEAAGRG
ncbi:MAG: hypothetical protein U9R24_07450, partial [Thermodesulfobacteriota bacterium]|nr:hypothetical protein [Thermodesulfobacteriota bacterium]